MMEALWVSGTSTMADANQLVIMANLIYQRHDIVSCGSGNPTPSTTHSSPHVGQVIITFSTQIDHRCVHEINETFSGALYGIVGGENDLTFDHDLDSGSIETPKRS